MEFEAPGFAASYTLLPTYASEQSTLSSVQERLLRTKPLSVKDTMRELSLYEPSKQVEGIAVVLYNPSSVPTDVGVLFAAVAGNLSRKGATTSAEALVDAVGEYLLDSPAQANELGPNSIQSMVCSMIYSVFPMLSGSRLGILLWRVLHQLERISAEGIADLDAAEAMLPFMDCMIPLAFRHRPSEASPAPPESGTLSGLWGIQYSEQAFRQLMSYQWHPMHTHAILSCIGESPYACALAAPAVLKAVYAVRRGALAALQAGLPLSQSQSNSASHELIDSNYSARDVPSVILACVTLAGKAATAPGVSASSRALARDSCLRAILSVFDPISSPDEGQIDLESGVMTDSRKSSGGAAGSVSGSVTVPLVEECLSAAFNLASVARLQMNLGKAILRMISRGIVPLRIFPLLCSLALVRAPALKEAALETLSEALLESSARNRSNGRTRQHSQDRRPEGWPCALDAIRSLFRAAEQGLSSIEEVLEPLVEVALRVLQKASRGSKWRGAKGLDSWPNANVRASHSVPSVGNPDSLAPWAVGLPSPFIVREEAEASPTVPSGSGAVGLAVSVLTQVCTVVQDSYVHVLGRLCQESVLAMRANKGATTQRRADEATRECSTMFSALHGVCSASYLDDLQYKGHHPLMPLIDGCRGCSIGVVAAALQGIEPELRRSGKLRDHAFLIARKMAYSRSMDQKTAAVLVAVRVARAEVAAMVHLAAPDAAAAGPPGIPDDAGMDDDFGEDDMLKPSYLALASSAGVLPVLDSGASSAAREGAAQTVADLLRLAQQASSNNDAAEAILYTGAADVLATAARLPGSEGAYVRVACDSVLVRGWTHMGLQLRSAPPQNGSASSREDALGQTNQSLNGVKSSSSSSAAAASQASEGDGSSSSGPPRGDGVQGTLTWASIADHQSKCVSSSVDRDQVGRFAGPTALLVSCMSLVRESGSLQAIAQLESYKCTRAFVAWSASIKSLEDAGILLPDDESVKARAKEEFEDELAEAGSSGTSQLSSAAHPHVQRKLAAAYQSCFLHAEAAAHVFLGTAEAMSQTDHASSRQRLPSVALLADLVQDAYKVGQSAWQQLYQLHKSYDPGQSSGILGRKRSRHHETAGAASATASEELPQPILAAAQFAVQAPELRVQVALMLLGDGAHGESGSQRYGGSHAPAIAGICASIDGWVGSRAFDMVDMVPTSSAACTYSSIATVESTLIDALIKLSALMYTLCNDDGGEAGGDDESTGASPRLNDSYYTQATCSEDEAIADVIEKRKKSRRKYTKSTKASKSDGAASSKLKPTSVDPRAARAMVAETLQRVASLLSQCALAYNEEREQDDEPDWQTIFSQGSDALQNFIRAEMSAGVDAVHSSTIRGAVRACLALQASALACPGTVSPLTFVSTTLLRLAYRAMHMEDSHCGCLVVYAWADRLRASGVDSFALQDAVAQEQEGNDDASQAATEWSTTNDFGAALRQLLDYDTSTDACIAIECQRCVEDEVSELADYWESVCYQAKLPAVDDLPTCDSMGMPSQDQLPGSVPLASGSSSAGGIGVSRGGGSRGSPVDSEGSDSEYQSDDESDKDGASGGDSDSDTSDDSAGSSHRRKKRRRKESSQPGVALSRVPDLDSNDRDDAAQGGAGVVTDAVDPTGQGPGPVRGAAAVAVHQAHRQSQTLASACVEVLRRLKVLASAGLHVIQVSGAWKDGKPPSISPGTGDVSASAASGAGTGSSRVRGGVGSAAAHASHKKTSEELRQASLRTFGTLIKLSYLAESLTDWLLADADGRVLVGRAYHAAVVAGSSSSSSSSSSSTSSSSSSGEPSAGPGSAPLPAWVLEALSSASQGLSTALQDVFYSLDKHTGASAASGGWASQASMESDDGPASEKAAKAAKARARAASRRAAKLAAAAQRVQPRVVQAADQCAVKVAALRRKLGLGAGTVPLPRQRDYRFKSLDENIRKKLGQEM